MRAASLFAGIGGFDLAMERAGITTTHTVEINTRARDTLKHHWPNATHLENVTKVGPGDLGTPNIICGGFPCQSYSNAGHRRGMGGDERGQLWWDMHRAIRDHQPRWVVGENVPGLLSSHNGDDFGAIIGSLADIGYRVAWRVLDARYFGVAQRRRRVFIVGHLGDGADPREVLFEPESSSRDLEASHPTGTPVAALTANGVGASGADDNQAQAGHLIPDVARCLTSSNQRIDAETETFITSTGVRRLTPTECERLQGFPDGWTEGQADSTRYQQLGNAVCVPVVEWIMRRLTQADRHSPKGLQEIVQKDYKPRQPTTNKRSKL